MRTPLLSVLLAALANLSPTPSCAQGSQPVAPVRPVTETYFGTPVVDNYRYMEKLDDPEVQNWMKAQATYTRHVLDGLPGRAALLDRITALSNVGTSRGGFVRRGQRYFYQVSRPGDPVPRLCCRDGLQGEERLLIDPGKLGQGTTTHYALDYFVPSWDGKKLAYGVSAGGSEASVLHVMEVETGKILSEAIDRASDSVVSWRPDNHSFFYLRYLKRAPGTPPAELMFNARTYLHVLGSRPDGEGDAVVFGRGVAKGLDVPPGQGTYVLTWPDSPYAIAVANANMDDNPPTLFVARLNQVRDSATPWRRLARVEDGVRQFVVSGSRFCFLSQKGAPRARLLSIPLERPDLAKAKVLLPEGRAVMADLALAKEGFYVRQRDGAIAKIARVALDGGKVEEVPLPFEGNAFLSATDPLEPGLLLNVQSWVQSPRLVSFEPGAATVTDTGLIPPAKVDASRLAVTETFATSYDGTRVPLSIIMPKGLVQDSTHPALLIGYGSYGISMESRFMPTLLAWVEHGGVLAIAHIRGGGEYGEDWHLGGQKLTKPNTILDFIACGQHLVDVKYTRPSLLACNGGSAGGITVGGAMTWRPDLFAVILDQVGISDALRSETEPNGPPNIPEFGSTKTEAGFHGLYAMSAYAHVRDGVPYPAVLFTTGANDPRVSPWHMAKMAARVQAATTSGKPVLLRVDYDAGHGLGSTRAQRNAVLADMLAFALWQMKDPGFQPTTNP
jgi:prolyl oligopeptidase